jgi:hypothetical protein
VGGQPKTTVVPSVVYVDAKQISNTHGTLDTGTKSVFRQTHALLHRQQAHGTVEVSRPGEVQQSWRILIPRDDDYVDSAELGIDKHSH